MKRKEAQNWPAFPLFDPAFTLVHPYLVEVTEKLKISLSAPPSEYFSTLFGPTGAGKSHIAKALVLAHIHESRREMESDRQYLPALRVNVRLHTPDKKFNWTDFYIDLLKALHHISPFFENLGEARDKARVALSSRRVQFLILDEADHFIMNCSPDDVDRIRILADVIKSIVTDTSTKLVLVGTYDLAPLLTLNAQLIRRNERVHFSRYLPTVAGQMAFSVALETLDNDLRGFLGFSLRDHAGDVYAGCLGLTGVLTKWLVKAATSAQRDCDNIVSLAKFQREKTSHCELISMLDDIEQGERNFFVGEDDIVRFNKRVHWVARGSPMRKRGSATNEQN